MTSSWAVHWDARLVKPSISANRILGEERRRTQHRTEKKRETRRKKGGRKKEKKTIKKKEKRVQESIISANVVWVIFGWLPSETVPIKAIWAALILSKVMHCRWVTLRPS